MENKMIDMHNIMQDLELSEREYYLLQMCLDYHQNPFGAPNHLLMELVAKLWKKIEDENIEP